LHLPSQQEMLARDRAAAEAHATRAKGRATLEPGVKAQAREAAAAPLPGAAVRRLRFGAILLYSAPMAGVGFMEVLFAMYLMKFSTDVLSVTPAAMGVIFLVARICGAVSDPVAGFLSDRTRTRMGRRRPWLLATALPLAAVFALMWSPPAALAQPELVLWMGATVVLFQMAINVYAMPHDALGAELSDDYQDRNRIFGTRRVLFGIGAFAVFAAYWRLTSSADPRAEAAWIGALAAALAAALMIHMALAIRERPEHQGRGGMRPGRALADVWRNPHARLLLLVFFTQQLATGAITIVAAYHTQYVIGSPRALIGVLGAFFAVSVLSVPVWIRFGRRFEKKRLLVASMSMVCAALGGMFFIGEGDAGWMVFLAGIAGAAGGGADVVFPSLQADVIDYDEYRTGERKEGVYFAAWNFVAKTALGLTGMVTGFALAASGFDPNREQTEGAKLAIRTLMSGYPLVCYSAGVLLFLRFGLSRRAHAELRAALDARSHPGSR
jgi:GPH family glycoside/pentoside/hexuronide:cation symporter